MLLRRIAHRRATVVYAVAGFLLMQRLRICRFVFVSMPCSAAAFFAAAARFRSSTNSACRACSSSSSSRCIAAASRRTAALCCVSTSAIDAQARCQHVTYSCRRVSHASLTLTRLPWRPPAPRRGRRRGRDLFVPKQVHPRVAHFTPTPTVQRARHETAYPSRSPFRHSPRLPSPPLLLLSLSRFSVPRDAAAAAAAAAAP